MGTLPLGICKIRGWLKEWKQIYSFPKFQKLIHMRFSPRRESVAPKPRKHTKTTNAQKESRRGQIWSSYFDHPHHRKTNGMMPIPSLHSLETKGFKEFKMFQRETNLVLCHTHRHHKGANFQFSGLVYGRGEVGTSIYSKKWGLVL